MAYYGKLVLACAGSGKTTQIVKECLVDLSKKMVVTYTIENYESIKTKFTELNGCIPPYVTIYTWYSFLLREFIRPYRNHFTDHPIKGVCFVETQSNKRKGKNGKIYRISEDNFELFYFTSENRVYTDMISKLAHKCLDIESGSVMNRLKLRATKFCFDEVQDLEGYDLEILKAMMSNNIKVLMVGDSRQKTYSTHYENKNSHYVSDIRGYVENECKTLCEIDTNSLNVTHRCTSEIITLASKLFSELPQSTSDVSYEIEHNGIFYVSEKDVDRYLEKFKPMQLRDSKRTKINEKYRYRNFGLSKGLTFERVLIYPTKPHLDWLTKSTPILANQSKSKLYVAITRARYSVAFVIKEDVFKKNVNLTKYILT